MMHQLPLGISLRVDAEFDNFVTGSNTALLAQLQKRPWPAGLYIHGASGCGRSHLLHACAQMATHDRLLVALLPMRTPQLQAEHLEGLESCDAVLLDDLDAVAADPRWAESLFHLLNRCRDRGVPVLISASLPPQELECALPDLRSRLQAMLIFAVQPLDDEGKKTLLQQQAFARGLQMNDEVAHYLLSHAPRSPHELLRCLQRLDQASLEQQRRLTTPFVKQVMGW